MRRLPASGHEAPAGVGGMRRLLPSAACCALVAARAFGWAVIAALLPTANVVAVTDAPAASAARIEARSADLMAVGIVRGDTLSIHISRLLDNSPMRDAVVTVVLRGTVHPTRAEADGSYTVQSKDLSLPGQATVLFRIAGGGVAEDLKGVVQIADPTGKPEEKNSARQLGWWVLNFAVCIGFLMLISRRRKAARG